MSLVVAPYINIREDLLLEFFVTFSRFEYALKAANYARRSRHDGVEPNWDRFVSELDDLGPRLQPVLDAGRYLLEAPPRLQVLASHGLDWRAVARRPTESELQYLFRSVRRVRNNLFHGGKFALGSVENPDRNERLLTACLNVLRAVLNLAEVGNVAAAFNY